MWGTSRYFCDRFWAPRYWLKIGATPLFVQLRRVIGFQKSGERSVDHEA